MAPQGLIAHGRGEAFDYLIGEKTTYSAMHAELAAAALVLTAQYPVLSVNGNTAALVGREIVNLASKINAPIEVNLFHRTTKREQRIARYLRGLGAKKIFGIGENASATIPRVSSPRKKVDPRGIGMADVVLIPLEDGDRAEALRAEGKHVIAIDLNPFSRTSQVASISIVDNVIRALPSLLRGISKMKSMPRTRLVNITKSFDNKQNLTASVEEMVEYLHKWRRS